MSFALRQYFPPDFEKESLKNAPDAALAQVPADQVAPEGYHAMSIFPEYFKIEGKWLLAEESRMDCVPVYENGKILVKEFRLLKKGEQVVVGRTEDGTEGIYVHPDGFRDSKSEQGDVFAFRRNRSRETAFSRDYDELYQVLRHDREKEHIDNGIIYSCEKYHVPYVLAGSIRDDGPLPPVYGNVYEAQDRMRDQVRSATTVLCMATMLHSIAVGNMTPSYRVLADGTVRRIYFYCVDISEFTVNKLADRGSLAAKGIVTNVQDFIKQLAEGLGV
jgi:hypothetical protein